MSGKIGKYTYKNESVLKEFIGSLIRALAGRKAKQIRKQLAKDPEMQQVMINIENIDPMFICEHRAIGKGLLPGLLDEHPESLIYTDESNFF